MSDTYNTIYFDGKNQRFALVCDVACVLDFVHWHELNRHGLRALRSGDTFSARAAVATALPHSRGLSLSSVTKTGTPLAVPNRPNVIENATVSSEDLRWHLSDGTAQTPLVLIGCVMDEDVEFDGIVSNHTVALVDCTFRRNFRLIDCVIDGDLWLCNSRFQEHFSLKASEIRGSVHLEGADFSGQGGASFRGIKADNLYLDIGVTGGEDVFWLNEMHIPGAVSVSGTFKTELQILGRQDTSTCAQLWHGSIGSVIIGGELYDSESANETSVGRSCRMEDLVVRNTIIVTGLQAGDVRFSNVTSPMVALRNCSIDKDLIIKSCAFTGAPGIAMTPTEPPVKESLSLHRTSIARHLVIDDNDIDGNVDFSDLAVGVVTYFENNKLGRNSALDLFRFSTSRFMITPSSVLFGSSKRRLFSPRSFGLLKNTDDRLLGDQYCALKHWLADTGHLDLEDTALFHMRDQHNSNFFARFLLGRVFGWGVRLSNIALSSLLLVLVFGLIYIGLNPDMSFTSAFMMSMQSFISSFFGAWDNYKRDAVVAAIVTFESVVGILFITVFIGAYIRKLLR